MERPLYETSEDLSKESEVANHIAQAWRAQFTKLPIRYGLDFLILRDNKIVGVAEVKVRNYTMQEIEGFGGYMLSLGKFISAKTLSESLSVPFFLIVKTKDGIYYSTFRNDFIPKATALLGRNDRNDWQDIEPCVLVDAQLFIKVV